jgi:hypothetical protein
MSFTMSSTIYSQSFWLNTDALRGGIYTMAYKG